jgi:methionyl-tRNA formyltransferase
LTIWSSRPHASSVSPSDLKPGEANVADGRVFVGTGEGILELLDYETADGRPLKAGEILAGETAAISERVP